MTIFTTLKVTADIYTKYKIKWLVLFFLYRQINTMERRTVMKMEVYQYRSSRRQVIRCLLLNFCKRDLSPTVDTAQFKQITCLVSQKSSAFLIVCLNFIYHIKLEMTENWTMQIWRRSYFINLVNFKSKFSKFLQFIISKQLDFAH